MQPLPIHVQQSLKILIFKVIDPVKLLQLHFAIILEGMSRNTKSWKNV
jgi:hypothetical protein